VLPRLRQAAAARAGAQGGEAVSRFHRAVIIPGSIRTERRTEIRTYVTVQCGACGHKFERLISSQTTEPADYARWPYEPKRTARCAACNRLCQFEDAPAGELNVVPLRRPR
jgi:hypothetical protein